MHTLNGRTKSTMCAIRVVMMMKQVNDIARCNTDEQHQQQQIGDMILIIFQAQ